MDKFCDAALPLFKVDSEQRLLDDQVRYIPDFLESPAAKALLTTLLNIIPWKRDTIKMYGRVIPIPRETAWYGDPDAVYVYSGIKNVPNAWIPEISLLRDTISAYSGASYNSVLLNLYKDGRDSLSWHADDEPELGHNPTIASLSLGASRRFRMRDKTTKDVVLDLTLQPGSLLLMRGMSQNNFQHCVPKEPRVNAPRVNLTFRKTLRHGR